MEKLRKYLSEPNTNYLIGDDLLRLVGEWNNISKPEFKGWYLSQIIAALVRKIIDPDVFLSVAIDSVRSWDQFPLVGAALRYGANPNVYFDVYQLGPAHALVYAIDRANKHNLPILERDALCVMMIVMGSRINDSAFDRPIIRPPTDNNYDKRIVTQVSIPETKYEPSPTVSEWLGSQRLKVISDYRETLKVMGSYVPSIVGASISNKEIAFMIPEYMPTFEYLINCQADTSLFTGYPLDNGGEHTIIKRGEIVGMTQAIKGACIPAFKTFINSGVECSYFTMNRLCYHLAEACTLQDQVYYVILLEMMKMAIKNGNTLDTKQYEMLKVADVGSKYNLIGTIEDEYKTPKWSKLCTSTNSKTPDYLQKLAFNLGIDKDLPKDKLCQQITAIGISDPSLVKTSAINRQRARISSTVYTLSEFGDTKKSCFNGQKDSIIPEEYNDTLMSFYRSGDNVYCHTSTDYQDMLITKKEPLNGDTLTPEYLRQIQSHLDIITSLGIDPSKPVSITKANDMLKQKDEINMDDSNFVSNTITRLIEGEKLSLPEEGDPERLNRALSYQNYDYSNNLKSIDMYQDLLNKLQPSHQIITFYQAVYYILRQDPSKTNLFLEGYKESYKIVAPINKKPVNLVPESVKPKQEEITPVVSDKAATTKTKVEPEVRRVVVPVMAKQITPEPTKVKDMMWVDENGKEIHPDNLYKYQLMDDTNRQIGSYQMDKKGNYQVDNKSSIIIQPPSQEVTLETEPQYIMIQPPPQKVLVQPPPEEVLIESPPQKVLVQPTIQRFNVQTEPQQLVFHTSLDEQKTIAKPNYQTYYVSRPVETPTQYMEAYYPPSKYAPANSYENYMKNPTPIFNSADNRIRPEEIISRKIINNSVEK
jgi:hypothetical protein